jgi:predicted Zn-dependent protease
MEIEADVIGLMLLAAAGFDPRVAAEVFEKLGKIEGDSACCDYIGSHPSCKTRSRLLSRGKAIEEALELYYKQVCAGEGADRHFPYGGRFWETLV